MRKILGLTVAALLVMGLVGGGTWAYFSDTESISGNAITAGTLTLSLTGTHTSAITVSDIVPGTGETLAMATTLNNGGSVAGKIAVNITSQVNLENGIIGPESDQGDSSTGVGELGAKMELALYIDKDGSTTYNTGDKVLKANGTVGTFSSDLESDGGWATFDSYNGTNGWNFTEINESIAAAGDLDVRIVYKWDDSGNANDNTAMGDGVTFTVAYELRQAN